ncbi:MAG: hypothetical protein IJE70_03460 [Oscillospiraceae bacterium]|nr:hypothetical protein [Oscillospiraceae bacterium]
MLGFVLPMLLSVDDYGYYKLYTLYFSYSGLLHFGFIDGILLVFAGKDYEELDRQAFRLYSRFFIYLEVLLGFAVSLFALFVLDGVYKIIGIFIAINMFCNNVTMYYQYISQAVRRFKEFSNRKIIVALAWIAIMLILFVSVKFFKAKPGFSVCLLMLSAIYIVLLVKYILTYRNITFGKSYTLKSEKSSLLNIFKTGIVMTVAYEVSRLALLVDQQFISMLFDIETYAQYAFAYNILSAITTLISSLSIVLLPQLKRMQKENAVDLFPKVVGIVSCIIAFCLTGYYPVCKIVEFILPAYVDSLVYFQIVLPALILTGCITIVMFTFFNALGKTKEFLFLGLVSLVVSCVFDFVAYRIYGTSVAIALVRAITTAIWYLLNVLYFAKIYKVKWVKNFIYAVLIIVGFYFTTFCIPNEIISAVAYFCLFVIVSVAMLKNEILSLRKR